MYSGLFFNVKLARVAVKLDVTCERRSQGRLGGSLCEQLTELDSSGGECLVVSWDAPSVSCDARERNLEFRNMFETKNTQLGLLRT